MTATSWNLPLLTKAEAGCKTELSSRRRDLDLETGFANSEDSCNN